MAGLVALMAVVFGQGLTTAGTASAQEQGSWHPYGNTNPITSSKWHCGSTRDVVPGIKAQVCVIRSTDKISVQAAVIVRNNYSYRYDVDRGASAGLSGFGVGIAWACGPTYIAGNSWSVCFGKTIQLRSKVAAVGNLQNYDLPKSPAA